jgi:hypothetical protein
MNWFEKQLRSRVGRNRTKKIKPTVVVGSESPVPTPHQTGRTDFPYPAFRVQFGSGVTTAATVNVGDSASTRLIPLQGLRPRPAADVWTSILPSLRSCYRRFFATMQDSDFQTDLCHLTGRTGLCGRLSFGLFHTHRLGPPRLSDACLPDVLTTLTPTEFAGAGDCLSCEHRPSPCAPGARRLRSFNITRLIRCGSSSFRPIGSVPRLLHPSSLAAWTGSRSFRREPPNSTDGTFTHEQRTLRGLLRSAMSIAANAPWSFPKLRRSGMFVRRFMKRRILSISPCPPPRLLGGCDLQTASPSPACPLFRPARLS